MSEGISTSLQSYPSASQPYDLQELFALDSLSPFPSFSHLHINDLGLTPPPGSQLQQPNGATQAPSLGEERDPPHRDSILAEMLPDDLDIWNISGQLPGAQAESEEPHVREGSASHGVNVDNTTPQGGKHPTSDSTSQMAGPSSDEVQHSAHQSGHSPSDPNVPVEMADAFFPDTLFDPELALRELETALSSRKRVGEEAFPNEFDFWGPPEKRRAVELPPSHGTTPPEATPSLSSPSSSHRPEMDPPETSLNTPANIERSQTPDSLFDSTDPLFEESTFSETAEHRPSDDFGERPSLDLEAIGEIVVPAQNAPAPEAVASCPTDEADAVQQGPVPTIQLNGVTSSLPSLSDITRQRFSLDSQDIMANTDREVLRRVTEEPEYFSPYPRYGGALGYLPSTPGIHVKFIEVADTAINNRIDDLRRRLRRTAYERNKYKTSWLGWTTVDPATGKLKQQLLQEENGRLRRMSSLQQRKVDELKKEVESWKNKFKTLATTYNNLLFEYETHRRMANVASIPAGYIPQQPMAQQFMPQRPTPRPQMQPPVQAQQPPVASSWRPSCPSQRASAGQASPEQVTIDLTEEADEEDSNIRPASPAVPAQERVELLQSMRNKTYDWLRSKNRSQSQSGPPVISPGDATPQTSNRESDNQSARNLSHVATTTEVASHNSPDDDDDDDELLRTMEEELARG